MTDTTLDLTKPVQTVLKDGTATSDEVLLAAGFEKDPAPYNYRKEWFMDHPDFPDDSVKTYYLAIYWSHTNLQDAVDLFKAKLPGWEWMRHKDGMMEVFNRTKDYNFRRFTGYLEDPATALLIAMFDALAAMTEREDT